MARSCSRTPPTNPATTRSSTSAPRRLKGASRPRSFAARSLAEPGQHHRRVARPVSPEEFDLHPATRDDLAVGLGEGGAGEALGTGRVGVPDAALTEGAVAAAVRGGGAGGGV